MLLDDVTAAHSESDTHNTKYEDVRRMKDTHKIVERQQNLT